MLKKCLLNIVFMSLLELHGFCQYTRNVLECVHSTVVRFVIFTLAFCLHFEHKAIIQLHELSYLYSVLVCVYLCRYDCPNVLLLNNRFAYALNLKIVFCLRRDAVRVILTCPSSYHMLLIIISETPQVTRYKKKSFTNLTIDRLCCMSVI